MVVVELVVVVVEEVIILTGVALLGGFGLLILETVIPVVRILTPLSETDWKLFLQILKLQTYTILSKQEELWLAWTLQL